MTSAFFWKNSISLCPASLCTPRPICLLLQVFLDFLLLPLLFLPYFCPFQCPKMKRTSLGVLILESLVGLHRTIHLQLLISITLRGIDLDYRDIEWFALETNRDHSVIFETASKYCILDSFVDYDGYSVSSKGFLPTIVYIIII